MAALNSALFSAVAASDGGSPGPRLMLRIARADLVAFRSKSNERRKYAASAIVDGFDSAAKTNTEMPTHICPGACASMVSRNWRNRVLGHKSHARDRRAHGTGGRARHGGANGGSSGIRDGAHGLAACSIPALRAALILPAVALRHELLF